ncbi:alpha/beta fold hydrolase [Deinococcus sp.]|uniref:alpha/beta fold hydrolase n=1 Tax=Deinococcus sp. TaxID=47478 RepID=UPI003CC59857
MKKRYVLAALLGLLVIGAVRAQAVAVPAAPFTPQPGAGLPTVTPSASALPPAFSADRYSFALPGFGNVAYYADPSGTGRPLLLLTSVNAAASAFEMRPIFLSYRGSRPVYVLEWPGFGSSDRPDIRYSPALMTAALTTMVSLIGADVDVVALSLGSEFAARAALAEPRIKSLALISPTGLSEAKTPEGLAAESRDSENAYRTLSSPLLSGILYGSLTLPFVIDLFLRRSFEGDPDPGLLAYSVASTRQPGSVYAPLFFISGLLRTPDAYNELYSKLSVPTLLLYDRDGYINFTRLPDLTRANPNVTALRIAPTKGLPQFEQMEQVRAALDAFWARK